MTAADFSANLRAEMARQGVDLQELLRRMSDAQGDSEKPIPVGFNRAYLLCTCNPEHLLADPTPAEITAIATALGCPEERLTVSREELERRCEEYEESPCRRPSCRVSIRTLSDEVDRIPDLLREIDEWRDRELHLSQMLSIEKDEIATLTARVAELEAALRTSEHRRDIERECRAPVCELEAENEALRKRVAETNDAIMRLVPMHTPGGTVAEKIAAYIEQLKRDRDSAIDRKWLDDAAREKCRVLQLAAKHSRRVAELEAQVQECHEWADTNQCWQDIAEIFGPRKGAPQ